MSKIEEIKKRMQELQKELEFERRNSNELEYPFESDEGYLYLDTNGGIAGNWWRNHYLDKQYYRQGNVFKRKEEAEKERDRRELLTRFKQFRNKCNRGWKPDWTDSETEKYFISSVYHDYNDVQIFRDFHTEYNSFTPFGYFKNEEDCLRAIDLFGDEIKRLYVEE